MKNTILILMLILTNGHQVLYAQSIPPEKIAYDLCTNCDSVLEIDFYYYSWDYNAISYKEQDIRNNLEGFTKIFTITNADTINQILSAYQNIKYRSYNDSNSKNSAVTMVMDVHMKNYKKHTILIGPYFSISDKHCSKYWNFEFIIRVLQAVPKTNTRLE